MNAVQRWLLKLSGSSEEELTMKVEEQEKRIRERRGRRVKSRVSVSVSVETTLGNLSKDIDGSPEDAPRRGRR